MVQLEHMSWAGQCGCSQWADFKESADVSSELRSVRNGHRPALMLCGW